MYSAEYGQVHYKEDCREAGARQHSPLVENCLQFMYSMGNIILESTSELNSSDDQ